MKIGDKIVCVDGHFPKRDHPSERFPKKGEIYTIRGFDEVTIIGIYLEEIVNIPLMYAEGYGELSFKPTRFRPVDYNFGEEVCEALEKTLAPKEYEPA